MALRVRRLGLSRAGAGGRGGRAGMSDCGQRLGGWGGGGYWRWVRGPGSERLWIRRYRGSKRRRSHALLP